MNHWVLYMVHEEILGMRHINISHDVRVNYEQYSNLELVGLGELVFETSSQGASSHTVFGLHKSVYFRN